MSSLLAAKAKVSTSRAARFAKQRFERALQQSDSDDGDDASSTGLDDSGGESYNIRPYVDVVLDHLAGKVTPQSANTDSNGSKKKASGECIDVATCPCSLTAQHCCSPIKSRLCRIIHRA